MIIQDLHFIRPLWLVSLVPMAGLLWWFLKKTDLAQSGLEVQIDRHVIRRLVSYGGVVSSQRCIVILLALVWLLSAVAMAKPAWHRERPRFAGFEPTVILVSLSQSMNATDENPTRLVRTRRKVSDLLRIVDGGQIGLVIYADQPFIALPLTDELKVIEDVLAQISTDIISVVNNRLDLAINQAVSMLKVAGQGQGQILVLADDLGAQSQKAFDAAAKAKQTGFTVSSILVGSETGAVARDYRGRAIVDASGNPVISKLDAAGLRKLSAVGGGKSSPLSATIENIETVLHESVASDSG